MSKRARTASLSANDLQTAKKAGLLPFETLEGKNWVTKALNPADVSVAAVGIPSENVHNISVLNWQNDYDISAPASVSATIPSFDVDLFMYHNPLLFGTSIAFPSGTIDLSEVKQMQISYTGTATTQNGTISIVPSVAPDASVALRLVRQLVNTQINPSQFGYSNSLSSRRAFWAQLAQKSRMTYGAVTVVPTCSELNNGGAISCCQQICQPRKTTLAANPAVVLNTFTNSDFPDVGDAIQNPQMYYSRFYDGLYAPYKLRNFNNDEFIPTERQVTSRCPYVVTGVSAIGATTRTSDTNYVLTEVPLDMVASTTSTSFTLSNTAASRTKFYCEEANTPLITAIRFYVVTLTGQRGYFDMSLMNVGTSKPSPLFFTNDSLVTPVNTFAVLSYPNEGTHAVGPSLDAITLAKKSAGTLVLPEVLTMYQSPGDSSELDNPWGSWFFSQDITVGPNVNPEYKLPTIADNVGTNMLSVHMTGVSSTAPIKLIVRYGAEIQVVSNTVYSAYRYTGPKYDESAKKTYGRCIRAMRDGYFANAGVPAGQADFTQRLRMLVEYDQPDDLLRIMNQGGVFQGSIGG